MTHPHTSVESDRPSKSSLKISFAVARQRVHDLHFHAVMDLIERARGEVAAPQAVSIYTRVHGMSEAEAQALKSRVMVHMGQATEADIQHLPNTFVAIDGAVEWDISASLMNRIKKRVGGRRRHAFREWVELHTGLVETQLLRLHVECVRETRRAAAPDVRLKDLVRSYAQEMRVRESMLDALYFGLLEQLFGELPSRVDQATQGEAGSVAGESSDGESDSAAGADARTKKRRPA